jgi:hypothetical protein
MGAAGGLLAGKGEQAPDPQVFIDQRLPKGAQVTLNGKSYTSNGPGAGGPPPGAPPQAVPQPAPSGSPQTPSSAKPVAPADDLEVLRRAGFPENEIKILTPDEIKAVADEARGFENRRFLHHLLWFCSLR